MVCKRQKSASPNNLMVSYFKKLFVKQYGFIIFITNTHFFKKEINLHFLIYINLALDGLQSQPWINQIHDGYSFVTFIWQKARYLGAASI